MRETMMAEPSKECRTMLKSEAAEHAVLWKDKGFRTAVEKRLKGAKAPRKVMGKR
jgi:hypothetical protein